jgi:hypothetical protein
MALREALLLGWQTQHVNGIPTHLSEKLEPRIPELRQL